MANGFELLLVYKLNSDGDYSNALLLSTDIVERTIKYKDTVSVREAYTVMAKCYTLMMDTDEAIKSYKKAIPYILSKEKKEGLFDIYTEIADSYASASLPDSGLVYAQKAMTLANDINDDFHYSLIYGVTGKNYIVKKDYDLALPFLRKSWKLFKPRGRNNFDEDGYYVILCNNFAQLFLGTAQHDSVVHYAKNAIRFSKGIEYKNELLRSYQYQSESYDAQKNTDSAYKYFRMASVLKDSLYDIEKLRNVESISFREQLKEKEAQMALETAQKEHKHIIQLVLVAVGIITFVIIFFLFSRSLITNTKVIKYLSILTLLMVFEFLNLVLHPFLERITSHSPPLMLLALVCIATLLVPLHHKIEHWAVHKLVEKNKQIRLAQAKKTIRQLEGETDGA